MSDLTSKSVEELREIVADGWHAEEHGGWPIDVLAFDELARRLEEAQQRSEAHDAEVAAKALEELQSAYGWNDFVPVIVINHKAAEYRAKAKGRT